MGLQYDPATGEYTNVPIPPTPVTPGQRVVWVLDLLTGHANGQVDAFGLLTFGSTMPSATLTDTSLVGGKVSLASAGVYAFQAFLELMTDADFALDDADPSDINSPSPGLEVQIAYSPAGDGALQSCLAPATILTPGPSQTAWAWVAGIPISLPAGARVFIVLYKTGVAAGHYTARRGALEIVRLA